MCENDVKIGIIGAGIAGIYAAKILHENNFKNFWIFEATDRIGGRIWSVKHENNWIELGAQWVHGQVENCLYEYANARNLIADPITDHGVEGNGYYCNFNGDIIDCSAAKELVKYLDEQKENMNSAVAAGQNVFDYFCKHFERFIEDSAVDKHSKIYRNLLDMFRWYIVYEVIDNSCDQNLRELSPLSYSEWKDCDGVVDLLNFRGNYSSIFDEFRKDFPLDDHLRLKHEVTRISLMNDQKMVKLTISDDQNVEIEFDFNHVIITSSIGFLKENLKSGKFFNFNLPEPKQAIIEAIGFGTINKIFLHFTRPFWSDDCKGIQCIWSNITDDHSYPEGHMNGSSIDNDDHHGLPQWIYCIQGFDRVRNQPNMLMAWIGGLGAKEMENYSDIEISNVLHRILQRIVPKQCLIRPIDRPDKIYCTRWYSNRFQRGSYSNRTMSYHSFGDSNKNAKTTHLNSSSSEQFEYNVDVLAEPIYDDTDAAADGADADDTAENRTPLILFAGEATDRHHYSTTHGAMNSGRREAWRLINYYRHKHNKNTN